MAISREIKTAVIVLIIIAIFIWGFNFLKDRNLYDSSRTFYAEYSNVQGLAPKSAITINGLKVGTVSKITFHPKKRGILVAHLTLTDDIQFSNNSVAQIYSPDFISGKSLKINLAHDDQKIAVSGDTLVGEVDSGIMGMINEQIAPLQVKVESFVVNTDSVMKNINEVLDEKNKKNLSRSLESLSQILNDFERTAAYLESLTKENGKFDSLLSNADRAMDNFAQITDSLQAANLGSAAADLQSSLRSFNSLLDSVQNGSGSVGKLMTDEQLYDNLSNASKELEELLREVKLHPKRFVHLSVFGKKEKPYVAPEQD